MSIYITTNKTGGYQAKPKPINQINIVKYLDEEKIKEQNIVALLSDYFNIPYDLFFHQSRCKSNIANARQLAMYLVHVCLGKSMNEVGRYFGRDRTTVSHACTQIEDKRDEIKFDELVCHFEDKIDAIIFEQSIAKKGKYEKAISN